jgi:hypothetical protein
MPASVRRLGKLPKLSEMGLCVISCRTLHGTWKRESVGTNSKPEGQFIVPDLGDKVDYGIALSYWPVRLHRPAGQFDNPVPQSTLSPSQGLWN